jgi:hypothetical protein
MGSCLVVNVPEIWVPIGNYELNPDKKIQNIDLLVLTLFNIIQAWTFFWSNMK